MTSGNGPCLEIRQSIRSIPAPISFETAIRHVHFGLTNYKFPFVFLPGYRVFPFDKKNRRGVRYVA